MKRDDDWIVILIAFALLAACFYNVASTLAVYLEVRNGY